MSTCAGDSVFPKSGITYPAKTLTISGAPVTVHLVALSNFTGVAVRPVELADARF